MSLRECEKVRFSIRKTQKLPRDPQYGNDLRMNQPSPSLDSQQAIEIARTAVTEKQLSESAFTNLQRWLTEPQYAPYQPALLQLIEAGEFGTLDTYFWEVIPFGTGGRRGLMSDLGSATINERTIAESAHGLAAYYKKASGNETGKAAIAHDSRINSSRFARIAASVIAAHGLTVYFYKTARSTPELSFAVRHLGCDVGAMITASHNPPSDNGFKAYWSTGGQVLPPHDQGIIDEVYQATDIPMLDFDQAVEQGLIKYIDEEVAGEYRSSVIAQSHSTNRDLSGLFSPLHGVGETSVYAVLEQVGFTGIKRFEPQCEQNGNFPNVPDHCLTRNVRKFTSPRLGWVKRPGSTSFWPAILMPTAWEFVPVTNQANLNISQGIRSVHYWPIMYSASVKMRAR